MKFDNELARGISELTIKINELRKVLKITHLNTHLKQFPNFLHFLYSFN